MTPTWYAGAAVVPLAAAAIAARLAPRLVHRVHPATATSLLTVLAVGIGGATAVGLGAVLVAAVLHLAALPGGATDLRRGELASGLLVLAPVVLAAVAAAAPTVSALRDWRTARRARAGLGVLPDGVLVMEDPGCAAYAVAGPSGFIVVSRGLMELLDDDERCVVVAHERAHLRRHHAAYVMATHLSCHVNPLLRPLSQGVRRQVERWADEDAAVAVGDRRTVARAVARTALATRCDTEGGPVLGAAAGSPVDRTRALLQPAPPARWTLLAAAVLVAVCVDTSAAVAAHAVEDRYEHAQPTDLQR